MEQTTEQMRVLVVEPGEYPREAMIGRELEDLQKVVGGWIEATYPFDDEVALVCNEEGLLEGLPLNRQIDSYSTIAGTFFICGLGEETFESLSQEQVERYQKRFMMPEVFFKTHLDEIRSEKVPPEIYRVLMKQEKGTEKGSRQRQQKNFER